MSVKRVLGAVVSALITGSLFVMTPASAVPNGTVACSVSGTFTVSSNVVTGNTSCTGRATIPSGITEIADDAFLSATGLTSAFIPNTVTRIGASAFRVSHLTTIDFEANSTLATIGAGAFQQIPLTSIVLPDSITEIGNYQFWVSNSMTSAVLPKNLSILRLNVFGNMAALTTVTLPINLPAIENGAFGAVPSLTSFTYCGLKLTTADLNRGGLTGKTRNCVAPQIALSTTTEVVAPNTPLTGYAITSPNGFGGGVANYSISPNISATPGLTFDTATGLIAGTPTTIAAAQTYTISANNYASPAGTATFTVTVANATPPPAPPIPDPKQLSKVMGISPESAVPGKATPVVISGTFIEKIVNVTINGIALSTGSWKQTSTSVSLSIPKGSPGKYSIALYNGSAPLLSVPDFTYRAPSELDWTLQKVPNANEWNSVAFGNGTFVAVGSSSNGDGVMYSNDGKNWKAATGIINNPWKSVAFGNGVFVAVSPTGTGNRIMYSKDGVIWSLADKTEDFTWGTVKFGNGVFVAVANGNLNLKTRLPNLMYSTDGITWRYANSIFVGNPQIPTQMIGTLGFGGGVFVLTGNPGRSALGYVPLIMTSPDGINWTWKRISNGPGGNLGSQSYGCGTWIGTGAVAGLKVTTLPEDWYVGELTTSYSSGASTSSSGSGPKMNSTAFAGGLFVAVGDGKSVLSNNATEWRNQSLVSQNSWSGITYGNGVFVAVAKSGSDSRVMTAPYVPLSLSRTAETVAVGDYILGTTSQFLGCTAPTYSISPSIEGTGLLFDSATGQLSGKPLSSAASGVYTISANDGSEVPVTAKYTLTVTGGTSTSTNQSETSTSTGSSSNSNSSTIPATQSPVVAEPENSTPVAVLPRPETSTPVGVLQKPETSTPVVVIPKPSETTTVTTPPVVKSGPLESALTLNVYFDMGSSRVYGTNLSKLQDLAATISGLGRQISISITGYAQPTPGSEATDGKLSEDRAAAVAKILRQYGVTTKVIYKGAGRAALNVPSSRYVEIVAANKD